MIELFVLASSIRAWYNFVNFSLSSESSFIKPEDTLGNLLKNPMIGQAALLNPLYAVQLAQLQAQLLSSKNKTSDDDTQHRKRRLNNEEEKEEETIDALNLTKKVPRVESPLDLSGPGFANVPKKPLVNDPDLVVPGTSGMMAGIMNPAWANALPFLSPFLAATGVNTEGLMARLIAPTSTTAPNPLGAPVLSMAQPSISSPSNNPLEHMSEIAKTGRAASKGGTGGGGVGSRHSAWQSQWINRGQENTKDIFKCVLCKDNFSSLQALTAHMRETGHFQTSPATSVPTAKSSPKAMSAPNVANSNKPCISPPEMMIQAKRVVPPPLVRSPIAAPPLPLPLLPRPLPESPPKRDILKEQLPVPRKLVRGQDVWLGKGEEQTKNILKCMYCGQSFRSLDSLTVHMQETKHYTKVMSKEQITSWKGSESSSPNRPPPPPPPPPPSIPKNESVSAVLTCKVCNMGFGTLKDLGEHMVQTNHFAAQDRILERAAGTEELPPVAPVMPPNASGSGRKPKSLPVKTLLEMERMQRALAASEAALESKRSTPPPPSIEQMHDTLEAQSGSPPAQERRPDSAKSKSSIASSAEDGKSSTRSILGTLEDMVQHNFSTGNGMNSVGGLSQPPSNSDASPPPLPPPPPPPPASAPSPNSPNTTTPKSSFSVTSLIPSIVKSDGASGGNKNPLAALQEFCDSTEKPKNISGKEPHAALAPSPSTSVLADPGSILAFSWACNQAVMDDSVFKCPFCDTPFVSKGAYRHHLSKVHFLGGATGGGPPAVAVAGGGGAKEGHKSGEGSATSSPKRNADGADPAEETTQNKYHKYAEMAKQLASSPTKA